MKNRLVLIILLLAGAILFAGCTMPKSTPVTPAPTTTIPTPLPDTVKVATNPQYGQILTDAKGMTLYYFARDTPFAQTSACTGACLALWPAFGESGAVVSPPLQAADFGVITRADNNKKQVIYKGWPLYYYTPDTAPGDTKGYGINKVWFVMNPQGVVTLAPTISTPAPATTIKTTVPTTTRSSWGGGGY
jgi:predicted lipoprotein with Yx(FWY)xxD motif